MEEGRNGRRSFEGRRFTSFLLFFSFLSCTVTGIFCYIKPKGALAHWTDWTFLGLSKEGWEGTHMSLSLLFLAAAAAHLWFNGKALAGYFRKAAASFGKGALEGGTALLLVLLFWAGTLGKVPPVSWIPAGHGWFKKEVWKGVGASSPPWDGAEKIPLGELAGAYGLGFPEFRKKLEAAGFTPAGREETLAGLAGRYGLSPAGVIRRALGEKTGLGPEKLLEALERAGGKEKG